MGTTDDDEMLKLYNEGVRKETILREEIRKINEKKENEYWLNREKIFNELSQKAKEILKRIYLENKTKLVKKINSYIGVLRIKYKQLIYEDDYGDLVYDDWLKERSNFIEKKLFDELKEIHDECYKEIGDECEKEIDYSFSTTNIDINIDDKLIENINSLIDELLEERDFNLNNSKNIENFEINLNDPVLFEKSIKNFFKSYGWKTKITKTTGDQGADVIAKKEKITCIVQCKLYSKPVGNKAVQEVYSAKKYYQGDIALVVTNSSFTKSAKQLASSTNVILLHYSQLFSYLEKFKLS